MGQVLVPSWLYLLQHPSDCGFDTEGSTFLLCSCHVLVSTRLWVGFWGGAGVILFDLWLTSQPHQAQTMITSKLKLLKIHFFCMFWLQGSLIYIIINKCHFDLHAACTYSSTRFDLHLFVDSYTRRSSQEATPSRKRASARWAYPPAFLAI